MVDFEGGRVLLVQDTLTKVKVSSPQLCWRALLDIFFNSLLGIAIPLSWENMKSTLLISMNNLRSS